MEPRDIDAEFAALVAPLEDEAEHATEDRFGFFARPEGIEVRLPAWIRDVLGSIVAQLSAVIRSGEGPAYERLVPPTYDPAEVADGVVEARVVDDDAVLDGRLASYATVRATLDADVLSDAQAMAWMRACADATAALTAAAGVERADDLARLRRQAPELAETLDLFNSLISLITEALDDLD